MTTLSDNILKRKIISQEEKDNQVIDLLVSKVLSQEQYEERSVKHLVPDRNIMISKPSIGITLPKTNPFSCFVVDEYGDVSGLVTVEDVLEEIVGDIFDKSQRQSVLIKKISNRLIRVDAKISVEELNKLLHLGLKAEHFNTLAGFVEHKLQRIPKKGEKIKLRNITIEIDKVAKQGIKSVKINKK